MNEALKKIDVEIGSIRRRLEDTYVNIQSAGKLGKVSRRADDNIRYHNSQADSLEKKLKNLRHDRILMTLGAYELRVQELEAEGLTRSDAQGVADAEQLLSN